MRQHADAIEADLERFYRLDIRRAGSRRWPWRKVAALIRCLPRDSALGREMSVDTPGEWSTTDHLLATVIDMQRRQMHQLSSQRAADARKAKPPQPQRFPRPGDAAWRARSSLTPEQIHRRLLEQRKRTRR